MTGKDMTAGGVTYEELLQMGRQYLLKSGIEEAGSDSWLLFSYVTGMGRAQYFIRQKEKAEEDEVQRYRISIKKRSLFIPLQYITGEQEFMGLPFYVNKDVLIPRQDTEILVETALSYVSGKKILDLCTGSGCIAVSLTVLGKPESCLASDISVPALKVARKNAERNRVDITFAESDLFGNISGCFDRIVSNPPYISPEVVEGLMKEVKEHEPRIALEGGQDGLDFYRRIIKDSRRFLKKGGMLFFEIGYDQAERVMEMMERSGFAEVFCKKDYAGLDRVVYGRRIN